MKTLVLGHGRLYGNDVRCSPIPLVDWINDDYLSVDMDAESQPDIVYDLSVVPWTFAQEGEYDRIIDTTGGYIQDITRRGRGRLPMEEVTRILKKGGIFYGKNWRHVKFD